MRSHREADSLFGSPDCTAPRHMHILVLVAQHGLKDRQTRTHLTQVSMVPLNPARLIDCSFEKWERKQGETC